MNLNECPYPPSPKVLQVIQSMADSVNRYPDGGLPRLTARMSDSTGIAAAQICWGVGSSELLANIIRVSVAPGDGLVAPAPTWRRFSGAYRAAAADANEVPNTDDHRVDTEKLIDAIGNNTRLVICVTPNNPSGLMVGEAELVALAERVPENVLLYVDEAYYEFAIHAGGPDALKILKQRKGPWVVTRTFSKAYALAGLRLGYAISSSETIANALRGVTGTFNVSAFAEDAALAALDDPGHKQMILEKNAEERSRTIAGFRDLGFEALPSVTNFVSARLDRPAAGVAQKMRERGIRIATWADAGFEDYIRVSMGLPDDTDAFLEALAEILAEKE